MPQPHRDRLTLTGGRLQLPRMLPKVCIHQGSKTLEKRFRGDMLFDVETFAGRREEVYVCMACGKRKPAQALFETMQTYITLGDEFVV